MSKQRLQPFRGDVADQIAQAREEHMARFKRDVEAWTKRIEKHNGIDQKGREMFLRRLASADLDYEEALLGIFRRKEQQPEMSERMPAK